MGPLQHTEAAIGGLKAMKNGKARNKVISKLEDALAWLHELEREENQRFGMPPAENNDSPCVCPIIGVIDMNCPIHGKKPV